MERLIYADALLDEFLKRYTEREMDGNLVFAACEVKQDFADMISNAPTVDAVEVVRCRDCKHNGWVQEPCHGKSIDYCRMWEHSLINIDTMFCSCGERKDGDGNG